MSIMSTPQRDLGAANAPSPEVAEARLDLAAALRWAARLGMNEGIQNHFTLAVPGMKDRYLVNPHDLHWSEVRSTDLVVVDGNGSIVAGDHPVERTAFSIHGAVHRRNPDARCVLHTHMPYATALSMTKGWRLQFAHQNSCKFWDRIAYDDDTGFQGLAFDDSEGERMAAALGSKSILVLASHGVIVTGANVAEAFDDLYYLEQVARLQLMAMSSGRPLLDIDPAVAALCGRQMAGIKARGAKFHFDALRRILDREEPDYAA